MNYTKPNKRQTPSYNTGDIEESKDKNYCTDTEKDSIATIPDKDDKAISYVDITESRDLATSDFYKTLRNNTGTNIVISVPDIMTAGKYVMFAQLSTGTIEIKVKTGVTTINIANAGVTSASNPQASLTCHYSETDPKKLFCSIG